MTTPEATTAHPLGEAAGSVLDDAAISKLFEGTNFGATGKTTYGQRGLMVECVLKHAAGYADGATINAICAEAGLLGAGLRPTKRGLRWALAQIYESGSTIVERLHAQNKKDKP